MGTHTVALRLVVAAVAGGAVGAVTGWFTYPTLGVVAGWFALSAVFCVHTWVLLGPMDADQAEAHATAEDPSHRLAQLVLLVASLASIVAVGALLGAGHHQSATVPIEALAAVGAIAGSWVLVHTLFTVRYARMYYADLHHPPIDFNDDGERPDFVDFAYFAFNLGMTYQVSDTNVRTKALRRVVLHHCLMSYLLGVGVISCAINVVLALAAAS